MPYDPRELPDEGDVTELRQWLREELRILSRSLNEQTEVDLRASRREPTRPREGMIVHADGNAWDPGDGQGTYRYQNGLWVKITAPGDLSDFARKSQNEVIAGTWIFNSGAAGSEGGEFHLTKAPSGSLDGDVIIDTVDESLRIFEGGGSFRGYNLNISEGAGGAGTDLRAVFDSTNKGLVPASGGGTTNFLRADATFAAPPASGGLTLLSSASVGTGTTYSVTGLGGYKVFIVFLRGISHNNGAGQVFRIALSGNNGSSYGTAHNFFGTSFLNTSLVYGPIFISLVDQSSNQVMNTQLFSPADPIDTGGLGPINALQFSFAAGNFDAGSIDIYGLK